MENVYRSRNRRRFPPLLCELQESYVHWCLKISSYYADRDHNVSVYKPLVDFFMDMTSPTTAWLVHLELCELDCSVSQLKSIAHLDNLESLFIRYSKSQMQNGQDEFDDSVLESLAFKASQERQLQRLSILSVLNAGGLSMRSFTYLQHFKSLRMFCVSGTGMTKSRLRSPSSGETRRWILQDK